MREILFRGKRIDNGEWEYGYLYGIWEQGYILCGMANHVPNMVEVDPETICQYTCLNDKNGKKIFEGDIVTVPNDDELYSVTWDEDTAAWSLNAEALVYTFGDFWGYEVEVVGNVYDNPDWLEV